MAKRGKKRINTNFRQTAKEFKSARQAQVYSHLNRNLAHKIFSVSKIQFLNKVKLINIASKKKKTNAPQEDLARIAYVEENTSNFEEEIKTDPYLQDIIQLTKLVKAYIKIQPPVFVEGRKPIKVGGYIKDSEWYESLSSIRKTELKNILEYLDHHTYRYFTYKHEYEAVQCVDWTMLLANLGYEKSPKNVWSHDATYARDLIPEKLRTQQWLKEMTIGSYKYVVIEDISEMEAGDLYVTYELPFESTKGHTGAIVGKKEIKGETTLLISDANRKGDGVPRLFEVNKTNDFAIFGRSPKRWIVIRKQTTN